MRAHQVIESSLLRLKWLAAAANFELAMRRHALALKYSPDQPRDDHGRWTDAGGGNGRLRLAASEPTPLGPRSKLGLAIAAARQAIKLFRDQNLLHDLFGQKDGTVTYTKINDAAIYGVNSDSPEYKDRDVVAAEGLRGDLIAKYPGDMATENPGQMPNNAVFHAETTALLRAARANGGSLANQNLEVHVDRPMCPSCDRILPIVGLELGDPTVTFIGPSGVPKTMRGGGWTR
jgi:hypothetical protein